MVSAPIPQARHEDETRATSVRWPLQMLEFWHLLSLDAPTVAITWCWGFAAASGVRLHPLSALLLGLATWLLYVGDRLLDGMPFARAEILRDRHHFHARHRVAYLAVAIPSVCLLVWLVVTRMDRAPRNEDLLLAACALIYLLIVHVPVFLAARRPARLFSKEVAVALIFAAACIIPAWSRVAGAHRWLVLAGLPFALLCWLNLVAIETWEKPPASTRGVADHLPRLCLGLASSSLLFAIFLRTQQESGFAILLLCEAASAMLLLQLDRKRNWMTPLQLRAAADLVLLTPAIFLFLRSVSSLV